MARLDAFLQHGRQRGGSDIHFAVGHPPLLRLHGTLVPLAGQPLEAAELDALIHEVLTAEQRARFAAGMDLDFAYSREGIGRFRANVFRKTTGMGATFRVIPATPPELVTLGLPPVVTRFLDFHQGLILVTGSTGTGKSTTLAAMIHHLNTTRPLNIITLEDPIEFVHLSNKAQVIQREVGTHVGSFAEGIYAALREDPDVILVGELRDPETITMALMAAETGHLVLGTLHTTNATKTLERIIDAAPMGQKEQVAATLTQVLRGVISQTLVKTTDGGGRRAIVEVLVMTPAIAHLLSNGKIAQIPMVLETGRALGMQLMDQALLEAVRQQQIDANDAYLQAQDKRAFQQYVTDPALLSTGSRAEG